MTVGTPISPQEWAKQARAMVISSRNPPPSADPENLEIRVLQGALSNTADVLEQALDLIAQSRPVTAAATAVDRLEERLQMAETAAKMWRDGDIEARTEAAGLVLDLLAEMMVGPGDVVIRKVDAVAISPSGEVHVSVPGEYDDRNFHRVTPCNLTTELGQPVAGWRHERAAEGKELPAVTCEQCGWAVHAQSRTPPSEVAE